MEQHVKEICQGGEHVEEAVFWTIPRCRVGGCFRGGE